MTANPKIRLVMSNSFSRQEGVVLPFSFAALSLRRVWFIKTASVAMINGLRYVA